jgi:hypothetical protein
MAHEHTREKAPHRLLRNRYGALGEPESDGK